MKSPTKSTSSTSSTSSTKNDNNNNNNDDDDLLPPDDNPYRRVTRRTNRRSAKEQMELSKQRKERMKKQSLLRLERQKRLKNLLQETGGNLTNKEDEKKWIDPSCFSDPGDLPSCLRQTKLHVNIDNECLICPIMDHMVPFHITTIKNCSISTSPDGTYFRINFVCPVSISSRSRQIKQPELYLSHRDSHFIKELTYRNNDGSNLQLIHQKLKDLQKQWKTNKRNKLLNKTIVKQGRLQRASSSRMLVLKELSIKPSLGGRKRGTGRLECHINGFKFMDHKKNQIEVLFNNIKNAFFQKAKNTPSVIIHFHLKYAIMIGKKPSFHVQVYRDVIERFEELGRGRRYDYDGLRAEEEEQRRIRRTNQQFKEYCDKIEKISKDNGFNILFEKPAMDLVFNGVPNKQNVNMYPTDNCIISLEDSPSFVIDCNDIEIAHFERVHYSLRNFDLVFVYKDFTKEPHRITTIPRQHLDTLQDFLNWKNVLYSVGRINLDWKTLMNQVRTNLEKFVESGSWDFLLAQDEDNPINQQNNNDSDDDDDDDVSKSGKKRKRKRRNDLPSEDEYVPSDYDDDDSDDYYSDEDDSDDDEEDYFDSDDGDDGAMYDDDEDDVLDWDELDRRAAADDKKSAQREAQDTRKERLNSHNRNYRNNYNMNGYNKRRKY